MNIQHCDNLVDNDDSHDDGGNGMKALKGNTFSLESCFFLSNGLFLIQHSMIIKTRQLHAEGTEL